MQELAFTLANGLTYLEVLRHRGLPLEEMARRLSFFFTFGSEVEFNVLGRVARRVWAVAMDRYFGISGAGLALRFHSQTSGRSLQDVDPLHNLTRVTLQAERALHNNTNSLHTNSYKETYTTPEEDDVLLAMGSQQVPLRETGDFRFTENLNQGGYGLSYLEDEVERAVHRIFREIDRQGGVIPAVENEYHRTVIQEEVQKEYRARQRGERTIIGVNYLVSGSTGAAPRRPGEHPHGGEAQAGGPHPRVQAPPRRRGESRPASPPGSRPHRRQRLRRAVEHGGGSHPGPGHPRAMGGMGPLPPLHVASQSEALVMGEARGGIPPLARGLGDVPPVSKILRGRAGGPSQRRNAGASPLPSGRALG